MTLNIRCSECGAHLQTSAVDDESYRLMNAAPDMLAALQAILAMVGFFDLIDAHEIAAPAVKKATQP